MRKSYKYILIASFLVPALCSAQILQGVSNFSDFTYLALSYLSKILKSIFALFSLGIMWTVFRYVQALREGNAAKATEFRKILIWAAVGMAVLFSIWGILDILGNTLGFNAGIPQFEAPN